MSSISDNTPYEDTPEIWSKISESQKHFLNWVLETKSFYIIPEWAQVIIDVLHVGEYMLDSETQTHLNKIRTSYIKRYKENLALHTS